MDALREAKLEVLRSRMRLATQEAVLASNRRNRSVDPQFLLDECKAWQAAGDAARELLNFLTKGGP